MNQSDGSYDVDGEIPRCPKCGCFEKVIFFINENSGEEYEYRCNNKNCKNKKLSQSNPVSVKPDVVDVGSDKLSNPDETSNGRMSSGRDTLTLGYLNSLSPRELEELNLKYPKEDEFIHYVIDSIQIKRLKENNSKARIGR